MEQVSNKVVVILLITFVVVLALQLAVYTNIDIFQTPTANAASGTISFCVEKNFSIVPIGDQSAYFNIPYTYDVEITEPGLNTIFHDDTSLFEINNITGVISFTPQEADEGIYYINISVDSLCGGRIIDWKIVKFTIYMENRAPILDPIPDFTINESELFIYDVNATDPDNDTIFYGENTNMFQMNSNTGVIYFTPDQIDVGNHTVLIWAMDEHGALDWESVDFEIIDVNNAPVLHTIGAQTAIIFENYTYDVNVTDVDVKPEWNNISFYDNSTIFNISQETGMISFYVNESLNGTYSILISVTDGELWDYEIISLSVVYVNHAPNITSWYPVNDTLEMYEAESQYFNITKFDLDGTTPSTQWYVNDNLIYFVIIFCMLT